MRKDDWTGPLVCYQAGCADSFLAAVVARVKFSDKAEYVAVADTAAIQAYAASNLLLLGCCGTRDEMEVLAIQTQSVVVVANNPRAPLEMKGFARANCEIVIDTDRSIGAMTWNHLFSGVKAPALVEYVGERELGHRVTSTQTAFLSALQSVAPTLEAWLRVAEMNAEEHEAFVAKGAAMIQATEARRDAMLSSAVRSNLAGVKAMIVNAPLELAKSIGLSLAERSRCLGVVWQATGPQKVRVVLTSIDPVRVDALCIAFQGSGTAYSGSFELPLGAVPRLLAGELRPSDVKRYGAANWRSDAAAAAAPNLTPLMRHEFGEQQREIERPVEVGLADA